MVPAMKGEIIGVMKNYHQRSLKEQYDPILYYTHQGSWQYISINIQPGKLKDNIGRIEHLYKTTFAGNAFEHFFLDDYFNRQYRSDEQFANVFSLFTVLAIIVACMGLLGLSSFVVKLRLKEIGIRKVLGASVPGILLLFFRDFLRLVIIATIFAMPIIYFAASNWLENFSFRAGLNWVVFVIPPLVLLIITFVTIGIQSMKAALTNPIKNLRTE